MARSNNVACPAHSRGAVLRCGSKGVDRHSGASFGARAGVVSGTQSPCLLLLRHNQAQQGQGLKGME
jgi:hypothetical protein